MRTIDVILIPNPYIALDADGVPQGTVALPGSPTSHIGALVDVVGSRKAGKERFYFPLTREGEAKRKVPFSAEIAQAVRAGELIAADPKSAAMCGVSSKEYLEPEAALEREKKRALEYFRAVKGDDAELGEIPREPTAEDPPKTEDEAATPTTVPTDPPTNDGRGPKPAGAPGATGAPTTTIPEASKKSALRQLTPTLSVDDEKKES